MISTLSVSLGRTTAVEPASAGISTNSSHQYYFSGAMAFGQSRIGLARRRCTTGGCNLKPSLYPPDRGCRADCEPRNLRAVLLTRTSNSFGYASAFVGTTISRARFLNDFQFTKANGSAISSNITSVFQAGAFFGALFCFFCQSMGPRLIDFMFIAAVWSYFLLPGTKGLTVNRMDMIL